MTVLPKRLLQVAAVALLLAALAYGIGLSAANALLLGVGAVVAYGLRYLPSPEDDGWPERSDERTDQGARREVARLSWNLQGYEHRVERSSVRRLRQIAASRLAEDGLVLGREADDEGCRQRLGDPAFRLLAVDDGRVRPQLAEFTRIVAAVERLR